MASVAERLIQVGADLGGGLLSRAEEYAKALNEPEGGTERGAPAEKLGGGDGAGADQDPVVDYTDEQSRAVFWDPFVVLEQLGYKEKPSSITYNTLRHIVWKVPLIQGIILTRISQVSSFAEPVKNLFATGFRITPREDDVSLSPADRKFARQMTEMFLTCGVTKNPINRPPFEQFLREQTRDTMTFDQHCFEVVRNRQGKPAKFSSVDASTIRLADTEKVYYDDSETDNPYTVQIYDNQVVEEWQREELAFCIRNPSTDIRNYGYGIGEPEMIVAAITAFLHGFDYNARFFSQGSVAKGLLNIKGPVNKRLLAGFRRQWHRMISGIENAWRSPVLNSEEVQWLNMHQSNRDMEFSEFMDFLIKLIAAVYLMDPIEVGFKYGNTGQQRAMFEGANKQKLVESKDKGLKPLLRHLARNFTNYIVRPIDADWKFEFVGLDAKTPEELADLNSKRVKTTHTVNELREEWDLPPLEHGDTILDPVYMQAVQAAQQMAMGGDMPDEGAFGGDEEGAEDEEGGEGFTEDDFAALQGDDEPAPPAKPAEAQKSFAIEDGDMVLDIRI